MNKFEKLCYLIVQRQAANLKRRRLLYALNTAIDNGQYKNEYHYHKRVYCCKKERKVYRKYADGMTKIAKTIYSPLRRELKAQVRYCGNNSCLSVTYNEQTYSFKQVKEIADGFISDEVCLRDESGLATPYEVL